MLEQIHSQSRIVEMGRSVLHELNALLLRWVHWLGRLIAYLPFPCLSEEQKKMDRQAESGAFFNFPMCDIAPQELSLAEDRIVNVMQMNGKYWMQDGQILMFLLSCAHMRRDKERPLTIGPSFHAEELDRVVPLLRERWQDYMRDQKADHLGNALFHVLVTENHWTALYIDCKAASIEYFDSKRQYGNFAEIEKGLKLIAQELSAMTGQSFTVTCPVQDFVQTDSYECGPWVCAFGMRRMQEGAPLTCSFNIDQASQKIAAFRRYIQHQLIEDERLDVAMRKKELDLFTGVFSKEAKKKLVEAEDLLSPVERADMRWAGRHLEPT